MALRDRFGHQRLREGVYTPGEIDRKWSEEIDADFAKWRGESRIEMSESGFSGFWDLQDDRGGRSRWKDSLARPMSKPLMSVFSLVP